MTKTDLVAMLKDVSDDAIIKLRFLHPVSDAIDVIGDAKYLHLELFAGRNYAIFEGINFEMIGTVQASKTSKTNQQMTKIDLTAMLEDVGDEAIIQIRIPDLYLYTDSYNDEYAEYLDIECIANRNYVIIGTRL